MLATAQTENNATSRNQGEAAFELWLNASLQGTYGAAGAEPRPDALLRLCGTARDRAEPLAASE